MFIVTPGGVAPFFDLPQAAIDAATTAGERTEADPALVLILPGEYVGDVTLRKHVGLLGFDRLGHFTTLIRGQITCDLTLGAGSVKDLLHHLGAVRFPPSGKTAGFLYFTGGSAQSSSFTTPAIEGLYLAYSLITPSPALFGQRARSLTDCRTLDSTTDPAIRIDSGSVGANRCDLWNRPRRGDDFACRRRCRSISHTRDLASHSPTARSRDSLTSSVQIAQRRRRVRWASRC